MLINRFIFVLWYAQSLVQFQRPFSCGNTAAAWRLKTIVVSRDVDTYKFIICFFQYDTPLLEYTMLYENVVSLIPREVDTHFYLSFIDSWVHNNLCIHEQKIPAFSGRVSESYDDQSIIQYFYRWYVLNSSLDCNHSTNLVHLLHEHNPLCVCTYIPLHLRGGYSRVHYISELPTWGTIVRSFIQAEESKCYFWTHSWWRAAAGSGTDFRYRLPVPTIYWI